MNSLENPGKGGEAAPPVKRGRVRIWLLCAAVMAIVLFRMCASEKETPPAANLRNAASERSGIPLRPGLAPGEKMTALVDAKDLPKALLMYAELTGRRLLPVTDPPLERLDDLLGGNLARWRLVKRSPPPDSGISYHRDGRLSAIEVKEELEAIFKQQGLLLEAVGSKYLRVVQPPQTPSVMPLHAVPRP